MSSVRRSAQPQSWTVQPALCARSGMVNASIIAGESGEAGFNGTAMLLV